MSITRRMTDLFDNLDNHFERICSPEDLERGLDRLRAAGRRSGQRVGGLVPAAGLLRGFL